MCALRGKKWTFCLLKCVFNSREKNEEKAFGELQVTKSVAFISFSQLLTHLPSSLSLVKGPCMSYKCMMSSAVSEVESTVLPLLLSLITNRPHFPQNVRVTIGLI